MSISGQGAKLPLFSDLRIQLPDAERILQTGEEVAASLALTQYPERTRYALLTFQQLQLDLESAENLQRVQKALGRDYVEDNTEEIPDQKALMDAFLASKTAIGLIYGALLKSPYDQLEHSAEDRDFWSQAWRWKQFISPIPVDEQLQDDALCKAIRESYADKSGSFASSASEAAEEGHLPPELSQFRDWSGSLMETADERTALYLELFELRRSQARRCSFPNYADYWAARRGKRSFGRREHRRFIHAFRSVFYPVFDEILRLREIRFQSKLSLPQDLLEWIPYDRIATVHSEETLRQLTIQSLQEITGQQKNYLTQLIERGYVSFDMEVHRRLSTAATLFPTLPGAFLSLPVLGGRGRESALFPALGEAMADVSAMLNYHILGSSPQDHFAKALSANLFLRLAKDSLEDFYHKEAGLRYDLEWLMRLMRLPFSLALYEFEERVYSSGSQLGVQELNRYWMELRRRWFDFMPESEADFFRQGYGWQLLMKDPKLIFSGLDEAMAFVAAMSCRLHRERLDTITLRLNQFLLSNPGSPVHARLESSGIDDPSREFAIQKAAYAVCDLFQL